MTTQEKLYAARDFAARKHKGQYRMGGQPYITHPVAVEASLARKGYDEDYRITGLFHDLLEDTDASEEEILQLGGEAVLEAVRLLTKEKGYRMEEYVARIRNNPMAFAVKTEDRLHNLQSAVDADETFRRRYILETRAWYMDFSSEIPEAVKKLEETLCIPLEETLRIPLD